MKSNIFDFLAKARDQQTLRQAELIEEKYKETNLPVVVLGKSYKPNINLTVGSPALLLCSFLEEKSIKFSVYDPICDPNSKLQGNPAIFFVATNHDVFKAIKIPVDSIVIDPWGSAIHGLSSKVSLITPGRNS